LVGGPFSIATKSRIPLPTSLMPEPHPGGNAVPTPTSPRQPALACLKFARKMTSDLIKTVPEDKLAFQTCATDNHVLWNLGHLTHNATWHQGWHAGQVSSIRRALGLPPVMG